MYVIVFEIKRNDRDMYLPQVELKHFARVQCCDVCKTPCMRRLNPRDSHFQLRTVINTVITFLFLKISTFYGLQM